MRTVGARFEFRVSLGCNKVRVIYALNHLDKGTVWAGPRRLDTPRFILVTIGVIAFIAMAVTLDNFG
jgi:hypothetical protein